MRKLYTYGYGGSRTAEADLQSYVLAAGAVILDIRHKPFSRVPGMSGKALKVRFPGGYAHLPALGNLNYQGGPIQLVDVEEGIRQVVWWLEVRPAVLLCGCKDAATCHRSSVTELAQERWPGLQVRHLKAGERITG